jgi:hypothetical protein
MPQVKQDTLCHCNPLYYDQTSGFIPGRRCRSSNCRWALKNNPPCRCGHTYAEHNTSFARPCNAMMPGVTRRDAILQAQSDYVKNGKISDATRKLWCPCMKFGRPGKPRKRAQL